MYFVTDKGWAIGFMMCALWCLGTWPVFFNIAERRGRLPQHTYMDYAFSTFIVSVVIALTLGQIGDCTPSAPNFIEQLSQQDNAPSVIMAMAGGIALCLGNLCMQYSLVFVGISLTEVISASLAVIIGTTANYFLDNGLNCAQILFPGVGCFLVAVILGSLCHASNAADIKARLGTLTPQASEEECEAQPVKDSGLHASLLSKQCFAEYSGRLDKDLDVAECSDSFIHVEEERAVKVRGSTALLGLGLAFITGTCYGFFSPLFNIAANDQFHFLKPGVPHLVVYTTFFYFSAAFLLLAIITNTYLLYHPVLGIPKSSISAYLADWRGRELAVMAGLVCGLGNGFQFMAGQAAGYAAADAVQALPLVGTIWGVTLFGEYRHSSRKTYSLLAAMLVMFSVAVILLIASADER